MAREAQAQEMGNSLESYRTNRLGELVDDRHIWQKLGKDPIGTLRGSIQTGDASPSPIYDQLFGEDKKTVDKTPAVAQTIVEWEKQQRERQSEYRLYKDEDDKLVSDVYDLIGKLAKDVGPSRQAREAITLHQRDLATNRQSLRERSSEALQWLDEKEPAKGIENKAMEEYADEMFSDDLVNPVTFVYDFALRDERMAGLRQRHGDEVIDKIVEFIHKGDHALVKELREDRESMREYWEIEDNHVANLPPMIQQGIKDYRKHQKSGKPSMPGQWADVTPHIRVISALRLSYRRHPDNRAVDDALAKWGYRGVPGNMDIRMKYASTRFLPDEPGGSLQPQQGQPQAPAQPAVQPQAQPQQGAPLSEETMSWLEQRSGAPVNTAPGPGTRQISGPTTTPATAPLSDDTMSWLERRGAGAR
jgi:hypothetical protein